MNEVDVKCMNMKHNQKGILVESNKRNFELIESTRFKNLLKLDRKLNLIEYAVERFSDEEGSKFDPEIKVDGDDSNNCTSNISKTTIIEIDVLKDRESTVYSGAMDMLRWF
ncbi:23845_t:CDS:1 [Gigaspora margarita]|uniref:23845_t:CDS:1 n=1 Tax=Gigaspora margarita TaxID=4874 RepID=A0ABN7UMV8_GIGMA|nr:23845_t:CDS:1 [Gigaspora margarita]